MVDDLSGFEWNADEWQQEWTISVGRAYVCKKCGTMLMVTKGGVGVLEPKCCGLDMQPVESPDEEIR